jgi:hypothetical protein
LNGYERSTEPSKNFVVQAWKEWMLMFDLIIDFDLIIESRW